MMAAKDVAANANAELLHQLQNDLHDLCQPLAALQCRLELGKMSGANHPLADVIADGLTEIERVVLHVTSMRRRLGDAEARQR